MVSASGHVPVVTELYTEGEPYLDSDAVFGVRSSRVARYLEDGREEDGTPRYRLERDLVLEPAHQPAAAAPIGVAPPAAG